MTEAAVLARNRLERAIWDDCKWKMSTDFEGTNKKANTCGLLGEWVRVCVCFCVCSPVWGILWDDDAERLLRPLHIHIEFVCSCKLCLECEVTVTRGLFPSYSAAHNEMLEFPQLSDINLPYKELFEWINER